MKIKVDTIVRTVLLAVALFNQIMSAAGRPILDIQDADLEALITTAATVATAIWSWWKNNSFTQAAIAADNHMAALKGTVKE